MLGNCYLLINAKQHTCKLLEFNTLKLKKQLPGCC